MYNKNSNGYGKRISKTLKLMPILSVALIAPGCSDNNEKETKYTEYFNSLRVGDYISETCNVSTYNDEKTFKITDESVEECTGEGLSFLKTEHGVSVARWNINFKNGKLSDIEYATTLYPTKAKDGTWNWYSGSNHTFTFGEDGCCIYSHKTEKYLNKLRKILEEHADKLSEEQKKDIKSHMESGPSLKFRSVGMENEHFMEARRSLPQDLIDKLISDKEWDEKRYKSINSEN